MERIKTYLSRTINFLKTSSVQTLIEIICIVFALNSVFLTGTVAFNESWFNSLLATLVIVGMTYNSFYTIRKKESPIFSRAVHGSVFLLGAALLVMFSALYFNSRYGGTIKELASLASTGKLLYGIAPGICLLLTLGASAASKILENNPPEKEFSGSGEALANIFAPTMSIAGVLVSGMHALNYGLDVAHQDPLTSAFNMVCIELLVVVSKVKVNKARHSGDLFDIICWALVFLVGAIYLILTNIAYFAHKVPDDFIWFPQTLREISIASFAASGIGAVIIYGFVHILTDIVNIIPKEQEIPDPKV